MARPTKRACHPHPQPIPLYVPAGGRLPPDSGIRRLRNPRPFPRSGTLITEELSSSEGIFVTAGHNEGVFAYGESIASTLNLILSLNMTKD